MKNCTTEPRTKTNWLGKVWNLKTIRLEVSERAFLSEKAAAAKDKEILEKKNQEGGGRREARKSGRGNQIDGRRNQSGGRQRAIGA